MLNRLDFFSINYWLFLLFSFSLSGHFTLCHENDVIDDISRSIHSFASKQSDHNIDEMTWYRLGQRPGTQLATRCVPENRCGAQSPGWLNGQHPEMKDGIVQREVCFHFNGDCCSYNTTVQIRKCFGNFYVYKFTRVSPSITRRYCTEKTGEVCNVRFMKNAFLSRSLSIFTRGSLWKQWLFFPQRFQQYRVDCAAQNGRKNGNVSRLA